MTDLARFLYMLPEIHSHLAAFSIFQKQKNIINLRIDCPLNITINRSMDSNRPCDHLSIDMYKAYNKLHN